MVSLTFQNVHTHDHFAPIATIDSRTMELISAVEGDILEVIGISATLDFRRTVLCPMKSLS